MGIILSFLSGLLDNSENQKDKLDGNNDLDSFQTDELNKGNYDSWNFEEEDLEDDDYYNEDDD